MNTCDCGHSAEKHGKFGCLQGFCKCEATKEKLERYAKLEALERLAEIAKDVNQWLIRSGLADTAHQKSLAEALEAVNAN